MIYIVKTRVVTTVYAEKDDMTFIMESTLDTEGVERLKCIGWYFGTPSDELTETYAGKLSARIEHEN